MGIDRFNGLGKKFRQNPRGVHKKRKHAGERPEPHCHHKQEREHHFIDGARGVHEAAHRLVDPDRRNIGGRRKPTRNRENDRERCAPEGNLERYDHLVRINPPVSKVRRKKIAKIRGHVAGVAQELGRAHIGALPAQAQQSAKNCPAD